MNYAVITKAKAMYGNRLNAADVAAFTAMHTVEDCAAFLKTHAGYSRALGNADIRGIHRGRLETLLNSQYYIDFTRLTKGLSEKDRRIVQLFLKSFEIETILWMLRNLGSDKLERASFFELYEPIMRRYSDIDCTSLINADTKEDFVAALSGGYRTIIERSTDYLGAETELWKLYYADVSAHIKKEFKNDDLRDIFGMHTDLRNIMIIFRLREYFNYSPDEIIPFIIRPAYRLKDGVISELCGAGNKREFAAILKKTVYRSLADGIEDGDIEKAADRYTVSHACKALHFSLSAPAVIYAYMEHKRSEINWIKTAIETVRYNLNGEMIQRHVGTEA